MLYKPAELGINNCSINCFKQFKCCVYNSIQLFSMIIFVVRGFLASYSGGCTGYFKPKIVTDRFGGTCKFWRIQAPKASLYNGQRQLVVYDRINPGHLYAKYHFGMVSDYWLFFKINVLFVLKKKYFVPLYFFQRAF